MAGPASGAPYSGHGGGIFAHLRALSSGVAGYMQARVQLAGIESKEALVHYLKIIAFVLAAIIVTVFAYVFLCIGLVFVLAWLLGFKWMWIMLGLALLHVIGAFVCLLMARAKLRLPVFPTTVAELQRDREVMR
jgi:uncharacterized membrane protein YqjE